MPRLESPLRNAVGKGPHFSGRTVRHTIQNRLPAGFAGREDCKNRARSVEVKGVGRTFSIQIASTRDEYAAAFKLLARKYQERGYEEPSAKLFRFTPFHAIPETITVVAKQGDEVVATLSLVPDTRMLGLPLDCIYREEVDQLRAQGNRIGEVTSLADSGLGTREFIQVFNAMIRLVIQYHVRNGGDTWVIAVNPRHNSYYSKVFGFEPIGPRRSYPSVCDAPADGLVCTLTTLMEKVPAIHDRMLREPLEDAVLTAPVRPADHSQYFGIQSTAAEFAQIVEITERVARTGSEIRWQTPVA